MQCRIELLKLLLQGVDSPTVSITHYLLGYPLQASLSKASLQDPGILNSPKTVLHSLLGILSNKEIRQENAALIQYGYELIYKICSNSGWFLIGSPITIHYIVPFGSIRLVNQSETIKRNIGSGIEISSKF